LNPAVRTAGINPAARQESDLSISENS
jgi:hypothetical protein